MAVRDHIEICLEKIHGITLIKLLLDVSYRILLYRHTGVQVGFKEVNLLGVNQAMQIHKIV